MVRQIFRVDHSTHRSLIEDISNVPHLKTLLWSRFETFAKKVVHSGKFTVRFLANLSLNDNRTTFGCNVNELLKLCHFSKTELSKLSKDVVKRNVKYWYVSEEDEWRNILTKELLDLQNNVLDVEGFTNKELDSILEYICVK